MSEPSNEQTVKQWCQQCQRETDCEVLSKYFIACKTCGEEFPLAAEVARASGIIEIQPRRRHDASN